MANSVRLASDLSDFDDLVRATAARKSIPPAIVEKDYYVVRALRAVQEGIPGQFVFKGGTSLSKGWNLLERFSEDLDLLFRTEEEGHPLGKGALDKRMKKAEGIVKETPGFSMETPTMSDRGVHRSCCFIYPRRVQELSALGNTVMLEMGTRGGSNPSTTRSIRSFVVEFCQEEGHMGLADDLSPFEVECLDIRRTFVEKLFAVHAAYTKNQARGKVRHYYDLYQLAGLSEIRSYVGTDEYRNVCKDVEEHTTKHWPDAAVPDMASFADSPAFNPEQAGLGILKRNFELETDLFFVKPPSMEEILGRLRDLLP